MSERDLIPLFVEQIKRDRETLTYEDHLISPDREFYRERIEALTEYILELRHADKDDGHHQSKEPA